MSYDQLVHNRVEGQIRMWILKNEQAGVVPNAPNRIKEYLDDIENQRIRNRIKKAVEDLF